MSLLDQIKKYVDENINYPADRNLIFGLLFRFDEKNLQNFLDFVKNDKQNLEALLKNIKMKKIALETKNINLLKAIIKEETKTAQNL